VTAATALVLGLMIGAIEVLYFYKLFHQNSFVQKIFYKTIIYLAIIISFLLINTAIYNSVELKKNIFDRLVWDNVWLFFSSYAFWSVEVYAAAIIGVSLFTQK
jgi:adenylate cyclase